MESLFLIAVLNALYKQGTITFEQYNKINDHIKFERNTKSGYSICQEKNGALPCLTSTANTQINRLG